MRYKALFWLILITGLSLRLYHAWTAPYAYANSDTATTWLMARHILHGKFPLFFYGQYYLGPLEAMMTAFFFLLFGIKAFTLYLGTIFYSGLFIISGYYLGKELKDELTGLLIMLYSAFPPAYFFRESIAPLGYHIEILFFGNIIFILTLKIPAIPSGIKKTFYYILLGLCAGIGFWTHYIILYYLVPVILYLVINEKWKNLFKNSLPALTGFFLISLPYWIFTFRYNFVTLRFQSKTGPPETALKYFKLLAQHISHMFDNSFRCHSVLETAVCCIYFLSISYFVLTSFFKRKNSILSYLLIFIMLFYIGYRTKLSIGEGYNYILPIIIFISAAFGYFVSGVINKNRIMGLCIMILIISFNIKNICNTMSECTKMSESFKSDIYNRIKFLEDNKIYCFLGDDRNSRMPVFFSDEKIIATGFMDCQYYPYEDITEASNRVAFEKREDDWGIVFSNICSSYNFGQGFYYNFKPHSYETRIIEPAAWHAYSNSNTTLTNYAFNRNYDKFWVSKNGRKTGMSFTIDMGRLYSICKLELFNANHYWNYPISYKVQTSIDRNIWIDAVYMEKIQSLFWSGPRPYWHVVDGRLECFFKPIEARFIRLIQIGEDKNNPWEINEIFIYEYLGDREYKVRDYIKDAKDIYKFLVKKNIDFIYADFWLSAKIRELSKNKIEALVPFNSYLPPRKNMNREVQVTRDRAFIVRAGDTDEIEAVLSEFKLPYKKNYFKNYVCYYFDNLAKKYESITSFIWVGIGLVKHSLKDYSRWLYEQGEYEKALKYYPNNYLAYLKCKVLPRTRFFQEIEKNISFENGIKFLGYSIRSKKLKPGRVIRIEYFWEVKGEPNEDLSVFVYFMKDGKIIFQNDHKFLYQFPRPLVPQEEERFREVLKLKLPKDISSGSYQIVIGLWNKNTGKRVKIKDPSSKNISKQIIGELVLQAAINY